MWPNSGAVLMTVDPTRFEASALSWKCERWHFDERVKSPIARFPYSGEGLLWMSDHGPLMSYGIYSSAQIVSQVKIFS